MSHTPTNEKIATHDAPPTEVSGDNSKLDTKQADLAADFLLTTENYAPLTLDAEMRLKRKIDWVMVPMVRRKTNALDLTTLIIIQLFLVATLGAYALLSLYMR